MLDHDDEDDFVSDIVEEVCSSAVDIIYQKYLERQLVPYIVLQAKDAILQITEVCLFSLRTKIVQICQSII